MGRKNFVDTIDENYVDQNKTANKTGNVQIRPLCLISLI